jgi:hypothetical protein
VRNFLEQHAFDGQMFGGRCKSTAWTGLSLCRRATSLTGDAHFIDEYRDLVVRMLDDLFDGIGSGGEADKQAVVAELNRLVPASGPARDARELAYCSEKSPEVFHAIAHGNDVFTLDPFDVGDIHAEARAVFSRLVDRASAAPFGKMLLIKGVAGSGKTHLMRAFRNQVHGEQVGFVAYMQMSTRVSNYARYLLSNVIDSWDRPYWGDIIPEPALGCLSDSLARDLPETELTDLRDEALPDHALHAAVNRAADRLMTLPKYGKIHPDLLRVMLYLQRRDPPRRLRVLKFLRCETLNAHDRSLIGDTAPLDDEHAATRMLAELGQLVAAAGQGALVLLVDQLEDLYNLDEAPGRFRLAMDALRHVTDSVPTSVIVVACLEDFYIQLRGALAKPVLDRLERDPDPVLLTANRSLAEIQQLIAPRLAALFEQQNVQLRPEQPLYPFEPQQLDALVNQRTRDVLDWCRAHHEASIIAGQIKAPPRISSFNFVDVEHKPDVIALEQAWNDYLTNATPPSDEADKVNLIAWALSHLWRELPSAPQIQPHVDGTYVEARLPQHKLGMSLCDKGAQGGALGRQIDALARLAGASEAIPIVLRSSEFPRPGKNQINEKLKALMQSGGRRIVVTDSEWRRMLALKLFIGSRKPGPDLDAWLLAERPLLGLGAIREILDLEQIPESPPSVKPPMPSIRPPATIKPPSSIPRPGTARPGPLSAPVLPPGAFVIGHTRALNPAPVTSSAPSFVTHAAFLGSTKSGKTTLALNILEHLLERGVPALLLDRKGDLCSYAQSDFWKTSDDDDTAARKRALHERLDVCVFTPGEPKGRALDLPVIPGGLEELPAHERGSSARLAATALASMMGYRGTQVEQTRIGILGKAIELVGHSRTATAGIRELVQLLHDEDPDLVASIGRLDPKHFKALVENLETLRLRYPHLLREDGERLSPELLFGLGKEKRAGSTRLSIISTKFLGDNAAVDFWVARLLGEIARWASKSPSDTLQAVVFLDEADIYLPATSKPATKEPVMDLLRRGRSAGVGVFIATQSPGDLDYKCRENIRSWFVGKVAQKPAIDKMKPLLSDCRINIEGKLAQAKTGEFFRIEDGDVVEFKAAQSLMRTAQLTEDAIVGVARSSKRTS